MGSKRALTITHYPQADSQTEILNQTLKVAIRAFNNSKHNNWSELLPYLAFAHNNTPHTTTKYAPAYLLYGFQPCMPLDFLHSQEPVTRPSEFKFNSIKAQEFIKGIESIRLITKDSLCLACYITVFSIQLYKAYYLVGSLYYNYYFSYLPISCL
jgi:hypothetical protein